MTKLAVSAITTIALVAAAHDHATANPCQSQWGKLTEAFKKLSPILQAPVCNLLATTPESAQKCVDDYTRFVTEAEKYIVQYNGDANESSTKIGPRGLGWGPQTDPATWSERIYSGALLAERTFISLPMPGQNATLRFRGTGGTGAAPYSVSVCVLDISGVEVQPVQQRTFATNSGSWTLQLQGLPNTRVMVYLDNSKVSLKSHKYEVSLTPSGVPANLSAAQRLLDPPTPVRSPILPVKR